MGVTLATFKAYYGGDKTIYDLKNITDEQWTRIMKVYWDTCKADKIVNQSIANLVVDKIMDARKEFYRKIVAKNPSQIAFYKGWMNRLKAFEYEE